MKKIGERERMGKKRVLKHWAGFALAEARARFVKKNQKISHCDTCQTFFFQ